MPKEIDTKIFAEPREAFQLVGEETYGPNWQPEWIDTKDSPERKLTQEYLRAALKTGHVAAHWSTKDFKDKDVLIPQDADQEFFRIDLQNDCVFHDGMNAPIYCYIHKEQLRSYIRGQEHRTATPTQFAIDRCYDWMVEEFKNPDYQSPKVDDHKRIAQERFPNLSNSGYKEARRNAIQITGRHDLSRPGPKGNSDRSAN